jgi:hypothetical protein
MYAIYFCLDDAAPVMRMWSMLPRTGDIVSLPEFGGSLVPLKVGDVIWEGYEEPTITVFLHPARVESGSFYPPAIVSESRSHSLR